MPRFRSLLAIVIFCALSAVSCAREPGNGRTITRPAPDNNGRTITRPAPDSNGRTITRPAPDSNGLSDWLEIQVGEEPEHAAFFIQMADRQGDVCGIVLNGQLIDTPEEVPGEARAQLTWLREELVRAESSGARHRLVFQHQSYILEDPDEPDQYFNIDAESRAVYLCLLKKAGVESPDAPRSRVREEGHSAPIGP
jgi:hypothetical protein